MLSLLWELLFRKKNATPAPPGVEERFADLERQVQSVKLEWLETLDKVERWMQRTIKRTQLEPPDAAPAPSPHDGLDPVSARLLARRHRRGMAPPPPDDGTAR